MNLTWILVANGQRARFFQHDPSDGQLAELAGFIYTPAAARIQAVVPLQTPVEEKAYSRFARQLADYLNKGVANHRCDHIALIATGAMLLRLRPKLSAIAGERLLCSVASDFTHYPDSELRHWVHQAVQLPCLRRVALDA
jgi:Protein required for attachment to host cells